MLRAVQAPRLLSDGSQLGKRLSVGAGDVRRVAEYIDLWVIGHRQVLFYLDPAAVPLRQPGRGDDVGGLLASAPDHGVGHDRVAITERDPIGKHLLDADAQMQRDPVVLQSLGCIGMRLVRERCSTSP